MKTPFFSLTNICAFGLLLLALYLNFVDLNKPEVAQPVKQVLKAQKNAVAVASDHRQLPNGKH